ncbi:MAG: M6 family metalloprotease domain-containing protein [Prevotella sp.]|nr:M6 family metalloprotease domain-containing protein [Prevotella sp.]
MLVILVQYQDVKFDPANTRAAFDDLFNKEGYNYEGCLGSVRDYFRDQSGGKYVPQFDVVGPVTLSHNQDYYGSEENEDKGRIVDMAEEACERMKDKVDFSKYGSLTEINQVFIVFAGHSRDENKITYKDAVWPMHYLKKWVNAPYVGTRKLTEFACAAELKGNGRAGIGTYCHEFSHRLGMPDYYDANKEVDGDNPNVPQRYSLMSSGNHLNSGKTPPNYSIFDKYFMGWETPGVLIERPQPYTLAPNVIGMCITADCTLPSATNKDYVYYIENRPKVGWDINLPGSGLLIWRVQYDKKLWENNRVNASGTFSHVALISASGSDNTCNDASDPFPGTCGTTSYRIGKHQLSCIKTLSSGAIQFYFNHALLYMNGMKDKSSINPVTIHYQDNISLQFELAGLDWVKYTLQKKYYLFGMDMGWKTIKTGQTFPVTLLGVFSHRVLYEETFESFAIDSVDYRVLTSDGKTSEPLESNILRIYPEYPYTYIENGNAQETAYYRTGASIRVKRPSDCLQRTITCEMPVQQSDGPYDLDFKMPGCPLVVSDYTPRYTVTFVDFDDTVLKTQTVTCGDDATPPALPTHSGMRFEKWEADYTNVHEDLRVRARYSIPGYALRMKMDYHRSNDYSTNTYVSHYGAFANSTKYALCGDDICFSVQVKAPKTATLRFETCYFYDGDDTPNWNGGQIVHTLTDKEAQEGILITKVVNMMKDEMNGDMPFMRKVAFRFNLSAHGIDTQYSNVMTFDLFYPITFKWKKDDNLRLYFNTSYHYSAPGNMVDGSDGFVSTMIPVRYPEKVTITEYYGGSKCLNFARTVQKNWSLDTGEDVNGHPYIENLGCSETFNITVPEYTVYFQYYKDNNGYISMPMEAQKVRCGSAATPPEVTVDPSDPLRSSFKGWKPFDSNPSDSNIDCITADMTGFVAEYDYRETNIYTVTFVDFSGAPIKTQDVEEGTDATAPEPPVLEGYTFVDWDKDFTMVTKDLTVMAIYSQDEVTYTVTFLDADGNEIYVEEVNDGEQAYGLYPPKRTGYRFTGWDKDVTCVHSDMTVRAQYEELYHTITFRHDGHDMQEESVRDGETPVYKGETPTKQATDRARYVFRGWTPQIVPATGTALYQSVFDEVPFTFTVIFQNWNHDQLSSQTVGYGAAARAPSQTPSREGYTFVGWDREFAQVYSDLTVTALFELPEEEDIVVAVEQMRQDAHACGETVKFVHRGNLYIACPDGKVFDANGREVKL